MAKRYSKDSIKLLESLGIDPLKELVMLHYNMKTQIEKMEHLGDLKSKGHKVVGYSAQAHAMLLAAHERLLNNMMPYRYPKVTDENQAESIDTPPITITLNTGSKPALEVNRDNRY